MLKAQQLMAENNLTMEVFQNQETQKKEVSEVWVQGGQNCNWAIQLASILSKNFRCNVLRGAGYGLLFIGLKEDVDICIQVYNFASHTLDQNMKKLRRQYRKPGLSTEGISGDYAQGFLNGLRDKFNEQVEKNNWGLVLVKDNAVVEYTKQRTSSGKSNFKGGSKLKTSGDPYLYAKGYQDGKSISAQKVLPN